MKFEFEKYQSQVLISLRFLSKNKDNELSAEKSKSYKYLMDKSTAKELVDNIKIYNLFDKKDPIFTIENAGGYNYRGNEVAIESIEFFTEDKYFKTRCPNFAGLVYLTKAKTLVGDSPIKCKITVDGLNEHELELIEHFNNEQSVKVASVDLENSTSAPSINFLPSGTGIVIGKMGQSCAEVAENFKNMSLTIDQTGLRLAYENTKNNNKERGYNMFKNVMKDFYCGPASDVKMSIYGPAFRAIGEGGERPHETYIAYHDSEYIDVMDGILDIGNCAYVMPVATKSVKKGDYIRHCGGWVRVTSITNNVIEGENINTRTIIKIRPTKNMFGFSFYSKLITFDVMNGTSEDSPFGNILPLLMLSGEGKMDSILPLMFMTNNSDFDMSNPMMIYFLAQSGGKDNDFMKMMMFSQMMNKNKEKEE